MFSKAFCGECCDVSTGAPSWTEVYTRLSYLAVTEFSALQNLPRAAAWATLTLILRAGLLQ